MKLKPVLAAILAIALLAPAASLANDPVGGVEFRNRIDPPPRLAPPPPGAPSPVQSDKTTAARPPMKGGDAVDAKNPASMQAGAEGGGRGVPQGNGSVCFMPIR